MEQTTKQELERYSSYIGQLQKTGKIEKAALIDFRGNILIATPGFKLGLLDTNAIISAINGQYASLIKLKVGEQMFTCFRNDSLTTSLIGRADDDVISVYKCVDFIAVGISDPNSPGSCIYEMQRFVKMCFKQNRGRTT